MILFSFSMKISRFSPVAATIAVALPFSHLSADDQLLVDEALTISGTATYSGEGFPAGDPNPIYPGGDPFKGSAHRNALLIYGGGILDLVSGADLSVKNDDNNTAFLRVGYGPGGTGTLNVGAGASLSVGQMSRYANFHVGEGIGATGSVNQTGGNVLSLGSFNLGVNGGSGTYTISGGTLTLDRANDVHGATSLINFGFNQSQEEGVVSTGRLVIEGGRVEVLAPKRDGVTNGSTQVILGNRWKNGGEGNGIIDQTDGVLSIGAGAHLYLSSYGNGTYNLNGGVLEVGGDGLQGRYQQPGVEGEYEFNLGGGGIRVVGSDLVTSVDANVVGVSGIDTNGFNATWSGNLVGLGAFGKVGEGTLTLDGDLRSLGGLVVAQGDVRQTAGMTTIHEFMVGTGFGSTASYDLDGGEIVMEAGSTFRVGDFGGVGTFNQSGGEVTMEDSSSLNIGNQGGMGTYNLSGGVLTLKKGLHNLGRVDNNPSWETVYPPGAGELNVSGDGLLVVENGGSLILGGRIHDEPQGTGVLNQTGGIVRITNGNLFVAGYGDGTYNLRGGTLEVGGSSLIARYNNQTANYAFNLGGGTVKVIAKDLVTSVDATLIEETTSTIDTNGFNANWRGALSGQGAVRKKGEGDLTLSGGGSIGDDEAVSYVDEGGLVIAGKALDLYGKLIANNGSSIAITSTLNVHSGSASPADGTQNGLFVGYGGVGSLDLNGNIILRIEDKIGNLNIGRTNGSQAGSGTAIMRGGTITVDETAKGEGSGYFSFNIGRGTGSTGIFEQQGGVVDMKGSAFQIGVEGADGRYAMSQNSEVSLVGGTVYLGEGEDGVGLLEILDNARFSLVSNPSPSGPGGQIYIGQDGGTGTIVQDGAGSDVNIIVKNSVRIGNGGTGTYELKQGNLTMGGARILVGSVSGGKAGTGSFNQQGGKFSATHDFVVGAGGKGTFNMTGGTATFQQNFVLAEGAGSQGTANLNGGVIEIGGTNAIRTGGGNAAFNLGGGKIRVIGSDLSTSVKATLASGKTSSIDTNGFRAVWSGDLDGDGNLKKEGAGVLILAGTNNVYTGSTEVTAGTLSVESRTGTGNVTIHEGATLSGSGVVAGFALVEGTLAPGNSPGTLTFEQGLTLGTSSSTTLEIAGQGAGEYDIIAVIGGDFTLGGALTLDITAAFESTATFSLFDLGAGVDLFDNFSSVAVTGLYGAGVMSLDGQTWALTLNGSTSITFNAQDGTLNLEAIPEPSTWLLLGGGAFVAECLRRRQR